MSAYTELSETGSLGTEGVSLLYRTVAAVARFDRYPPPDGYQAWTNDAVTEIAHDFLVGPRASERLVQLAVLAVDDAGFDRLLEASVRNFFRSRARATARGKLYRRLQSLLEEDDRFVAAAATVGPSWSLRDGPAEPWVGRIDALLTVAASVPVPLTGGEHSRRDALREMCLRVLGTAEGAILLDDLVFVAGWRLGLSPAPLTLDTDSIEPAAAVDVASESAADLDAHALFGLLTDRERLLLLVLDEPVREAAEFVGVSKSTAAEAANRLRHKLRSLVPDENELLGVLRPLTALASQWAGPRTEPASPAY